MSSVEVELDTQGDAALPVVRGWLAAMHAQDVAYCHFKSNAEVATGLVGAGDMDVLADRRGSAQVAELLAAAGFKRFKTAPMVDYPAVEDYLACDPDSGSLVHLHLHWQMIAGEPHLKGYRLPWEAELLGGRLWDAENGIYVTSREAELVLLLTRAVLKLRTRDRLRAWLGRPYFRGGLKREYGWLAERADRSKAVALAERLLSERAAAVIDGFLGRQDITDRDILALRRAAMPVLRRCRTYSPVEARVRRWAREFVSLWGRLEKRWRQPVNLYRRGPTGGGVVVALLGADGSGKSTQREALVKWLSWKVDVMPLYLGSGDGPRSLPRSLLAAVARVFGRSRRAAAGSPGAAAAEASPADSQLSQASFRRRCSRTLVALLLARERLAKLRRAFRARNRGMIVVTDRYPQTQVLGFNDGPLLDDLMKASGFWRACARLERRFYDRMVQFQPDLVIKLELAPETALARKPSTPAEMVRLKAQAVRDLRFGPATRVVALDAARPLADVTLDVRRAVWEEL